MTPTSQTETFPVVHGLPLRLAFGPEAIRQHFGSPAVDGLPEQVLLEVGHEALNDDRLYEAFHATLADALRIYAPSLAPEDLK